MEIEILTKKIANFSKTTGNVSKYMSKNWRSKVKKTNLKQQAIWQI